VYILTTNDKTTYKPAMSNFAKTYVRFWELSFGVLIKMLLQQPRTTMHWSLEKFWENK